MRCGSGGGENEDGSDDDSGSGDGDGDDVDYGDNDVYDDDNNYDYCVVTPSPPRDAKKRPKTTAEVVPRPGRELGCS